jgi:hypothetical protein
MFGATALEPTNHIPQLFLDRVIQNTLFYNGSSKEEKTVMSIILVGTDELSLMDKNLDSPPI